MSMTQTGKDSRPRWPLQQRFIRIIEEETTEPSTYLAALAGAQRDKNEDRGALAAILDIFSLAGIIALPGPFVRFSRSF
jgi:hypothetical protein